MSSNEDFFREKRATAVFKHGILRRYPVVFAAKAGSSVPGRRVIFLDGYAGPGQYDDGGLGSPMVLVQSADFVRQNRNVSGFFVESDLEHFERLNRMLNDNGDQRFKALLGSIDEHLPQIISDSGNAALFAYLDPFGPALERDRLARELLRRTSGPTEVLLHFSLITVARIGGLVRKISREGRPATTAESLTISRVNRFLGGDWWQNHFTAVVDNEDMDKATEVATRVAGDFCQAIERETGYKSVSMPVRLRPDYAPKYLLVLFTKHPEGVWYFADALGKAGRDWQGAWRSEENAKIRLSEELTGRVAMFDAPDLQFDPDDYERENRPVWVSGIKDNIINLLTRVRSAQLQEHVIDVYGTYLGSAWERHVRAAVKDLIDKGIVSGVGTGKFHRSSIALMQPR